MNDMGVVIRDANGRVVIGPDTFTVRLLDTVFLAAGTYRSAVTVPCKRARWGMFATVSSLAVWSPPGSQFIGSTVYDSPAMAAKTMPPMPCVRVVDGGVVCFPPAANTVFAGNLVLYVLANA